MKDNISGGREEDSHSFADQIAMIFARNPAVQLLVEPETAEIVATNLAADGFYGLSLAQWSKLELRAMPPAGELPSLSDCLQYPLTIFDCQQIIPAGITRYVTIFASPLTINDHPFLLLIVQDNTTLSQLEQKIIHQESILNQLVDAVVITNANFIIQSWNKAAEEIYGWRAEEVIGRLARDVFQSYPQDTPTFQATIQQLRQNGFWRGEVIHKRRDNSQIHLISSVTIIKNESGVVTSIVGVNRDITARVMAEKALNENERRFRQLTETGQTIPFEADPELAQITYVGPQAATLFGYPIEAWYSPYFLNQHIHPEDRQSAFSQRQNIIRHQLEYDFEYRMITNHHEVLWIREIGSLIQIPNQPEKVLGFWLNITEKKIYQFQLEASEKRFRALVEKSTDAFCLLDEQGFILYASPSITPILGYSLAEFIGQDIFILSHPDEDQENRRLFEVLVTRPGHSVSTTARFRRQDGSWCWVEVVGTNLLADVNVHGLVINFRDITDRHLIQEQIRENEQIYRQLFTSAQHQAQELSLLNQISVALAPALHLEQIYRTVVEAISLTFGYALGSLYTLEGDMLIAQHLVGYTNYLKHIPLSRGVMGLVARTGRALLIEDVTRDPIYVPAVEGVRSEICVPLFDAQQVVGVLNVESTDNVQLNEEDFQIILAVAAQASTAIGRAKLYAEVRENEERFRMLIENSADLIALLNVDGIIIYASPSTEPVLGYAVENYTGRAFTDFVHEDDLADIRFLMANLLLNPQTQITTQYRLGHRDGSWRHIEATATNLLHQPNVQAVIINYRDITERWQAEEALRHTQKMESLGVLAGGVAHDFNNLLTAMIAQLSLTSSMLSKENQLRPHIDKALIAAERAADLTRQLLAYSGREQREMRPVQLNSLIQENLHLFSVVIPKHISFQLNLSESLPAIDGDLGQIQQIIMNLLINAVEAIGERPGQISITTDLKAIGAEDNTWAKFTGATLPADQYILLQIHDNGPGMDTITLSRIFDPFFTTKFTGRGLGLSAVLGIVRGHRGGLHVESESGRGTTFDIIFPAGQIQPMQLQPPSSPNPTPNPSRVLLAIDDEQSIREAVSDIMSLAEIKVITAYDGRNGIKLFRQHQAQIGLILLDLSMPGLSGEETLNQLLMMDSDIKIILASGYSQSEVRNLLTHQRIAGFLQKPFGFQELIETVKRHLSQ